MKGVGLGERGETELVSPSGRALVQHLSITGQFVDSGQHVRTGVGGGVEMGVGGHWTVQTFRSEPLLDSGVYRDGVSVDTLFNGQHRWV